MAWHTVTTNFTPGANPDGIIVPERQRRVAIAISSPFAAAEEQYSIGYDGQFWWYRVRSVNLPQTLLRKNLHHVIDKELIVHGFILANRSLTEIYVDSLCEWRDAWPYNCPTWHTHKTQQMIGGINAARQIVFGSNPNRIGILIDGIPSPLIRLFTTPGDGSDTSGLFYNGTGLEVALNYRDYGPVIQGEVWATGTSLIFPSFYTEIYTIG